MGSAYVQQFKALLWRNYLLKIRSKGYTASEVITPIYLFAILIIIKLTTTSPLEPPVKEFRTNPLSNFANNGSQTLYVQDNSTEVRAIMQKVMSASSYKVVHFPDSSSLEAAYQNLLNQSQQSTVLAGVLFDVDVSSLTFNYSIRMPHESVPDGRLFDWSFNRKEFRSKDGMSRSMTSRYLWSGFVQLQAHIDMAILQIYGNQSLSQMPDISVKLLPKSEHASDSTQIRIMSSLYMVMAFFGFIGSLTAIIVTEKEKKIKETMRIMGLIDSAFWSAWFVVYFIEALVICTITTLIGLAASFFTQSTLFILFLLMFLYCLSLITFGFMMSTFFSKAKTAAGLSVLMTLVAAAASMAVIVTRTTIGTSGLPESPIPAAAQWVLCLLSPLALALGIDWSLYLDVSVAGGANFGPNMYIGQFPMYGSILMLAVDTILYLLLAIWCDSVVPNEYGQARPLWYCFLPSFWKKKQRTPEEVDQLLTMPSIQGYDNLAMDMDYDMEPVAPSLANKNAMRISNIKKKFTVKENGKKMEKFVVNGLSLDIYEGQITALLGHNGAGKTTLINMLTGLVTPTSGKASIFGMDVSDSSDMVHIRSFTGVCPQENILFPTLTAKEHLYIFGLLSGVPRENIEKRITQSLDEVDMLDKADSLSKDLSGGQKRKLSLAMALIGDPKVIFLDEPTAGMDPYSRRHVWSVLKNRRPGRVILLTTHFMDEADILADRKAVISKGELKCVGSSLFLKNKFGVGYHLNMVIKPEECSVGVVDEFVHKHVPNAGEGRLYGKELDFTLPYEDVEKFADLFGNLEEEGPDHQAASERLGISSYGVSMTTLEEVFLKLEDDHGVTDKLINGKNDEGQTVVKFHEMPTANPNSAAVKQDKSVFWLRFWALMKIRVKIQVRSGGYIFRLLAPIVISVLAIVLFKYVMVVNIPQPAPPTHISLEMQSYLKSSPLLFESAVDFGQPPYYKSGYPSFRYGLYSQAFQSTAAFNSSTDLLAVAPHQVGYNIHAYSVNTSTTPNQVLDSNITIMYNDSAMQSIPAAITTMFNSILRSSVSLPGGVNSTNMDNTRIKTTSLPWPALTRTPPFYWGSFVLVLLLGMAMNFTVIGGASEIVKEREFKVRGQLKTAGITHNMYMLTTIFADAAQLYVVIILSVIVVLAFQPAGLDNGGAIFCLIIVSLLFAPYLNIIFIYIFSYAFQKKETLESVLPNLFIWIAMLPFMVTGLLGLGSGGTITVIKQYLHVAFCIIDPVYIPYGSLQAILDVHNNYKFKNGDVPVPFSAYFEWEAGIIIIIIASIIHIPWMFFLWKFLDLRETSGGNVKCCDRSCVSGAMVHTLDTDNQDIPEEEDEDVAEERQRVLSMDGSSADEKTPVVKVLNLRKSFKKSERDKKTKKQQTHVAVKNVSFAVMPGEVFGLLGPNGAGKTTTLNMVIADTAPDVGQVTAGGFNVHSSMSEAFSVMGYCPQHDALWERITAEEHVEVYSLIHGVPYDEAANIAKYYMSELGIEEHKDKQARDLSGGTKRKLSYAMSMLGDPKIVLLDEPSTGMDPRSKRFLWDTIAHSFHQSSRGAILTTHYMEEADALCNRIAIMVNGRMECVGSSQHLKNKYGSGYILEVKIEGSDDYPEELKRHLDACHEYVTQLFPQCARAEFFSDWMTYKIPQEDVSSLSTVFRAMEEGKRHYHIEQYSFSQCTLEQVFLQFAKIQDEKGEDVDNEKVKRQTSLLGRSNSQSRGHSPLAHVSSTTYSSEL